MNTLPFVNLSNWNDFLAAPINSHQSFSSIDSSLLPQTLIPSLFDPPSDSSFYISDSEEEYSSDQIPTCANYLGSCTISDFNFKIDVGDSDLVIMQINCRSLSKNFTKLKILISNLSTKPKIITLSETWVDASLIDLFFLDGYNLVLLPRLNKRGGGVGVYISTMLKSETCLESLIKSKPESFELQIIKILLNSNKSFYLLNLYRPPSNSVNTFNDEINDVLNDIYIKHPSADILALGDYNIDLLDKSSSAAKKLLNNMSSLDLFPMISTPTRVIDTKRSLIDNIFVSSHLIVKQGGILIDDISDHFPTFVSLCFNSTTGKNTPDVKFRETRSFSSKNFKIFNHNLKSINWNHFNAELAELKNQGSANANDLYNIFFDKFYNVYNLSFPTCISSSFNATNKNCNDPWMSSDLLDCCKVKSKLLKTYRRFNNIVSKTRYKVYSQNLKHKIKQAELTYHSEKFKKSNSSSDTWKNINSLMKPRSTPSSQTEFIVNGAITSDRKEVVNNFNNYFTNIGKELASMIPDTNISPKRYLTASLDHSIFVKPVTFSEISTYISQIKQSTGPGPDLVYPAAVKAAANYIIPSLVILINGSLEEGIFPNKLKYARVVPLFKDQNPNLCSNYRPISILNVFSKIYEKVIKNRMDEFIQKNNILTTSQFGFRKNYSTVHPILSLINTITDNMDKSLFSVVIYLDFKKAFDTIDHAILLSKLEHYGIRGPILALLKSYLTDRKQTVHFNGTISDETIMQTGVPQGSILGPLLFLLYINDLVNASDTATPFLFADDTTALYSGSDLNLLFPIINLDLDNILTWCKVNKISLNLSKTKYMVFNPKLISLSSSQKSACTLVFGSDRLEMVSNTKFLGITIDDTLSWRLHIEQLCAKVSRVIGVLAKIRHKLNQRAAMLIYESLIMSHMQYCNLVWANATKNIMDPLFILQKRALKIVLKLPRLTPSDVLFKQAFKLTVFQMCHYQSLIFIYSVLNHLAPERFDDFFVLIENVHSHETRSQGGLYAISSSKKVFKNCLRARAPNLWSSITKDIQDSPNLQTFKKSLKSFFLNSLDQSP